MTYQHSYNNDAPGPETDPRHRSAKPPSNRAVAYRVTDSSRASSQSAGGEIRMSAQTVGVTLTMVPS